MKKFKKLISVILAVMMIMSVMPVSATESADGTGGSASLVPDGATLLFYEDFESGYTADENWINDGNKVTGSGGDSANYRTADGNWDVQINGTLGDDSVSVVDTSALNLAGNISGNALRIYNSRSTSWNSNYVSFRRNFNGTTGISLTTGDYAGKKLVYEADIIIPGGTNRENEFFTPSFTQAKIWDVSKYHYYFKGNKYYALEGSYASSSAGARYMWYTEMASSAEFRTASHKLKMVFDQTSPDVDTLTTYVDGVVIEKQVSSVLTGHKRNGTILSASAGSGYQGQKADFGDTVYGISGASAGHEIYLDNFKAYVIDAFEIVNVSGNTSAFDPVTGEITYTLSRPVDDTTVSAVLLDESGNEVAGGIESATVTDNGYKVVVKTADALLGLSQYAVQLKDTIRDTEGDSLSRKYYYYNYDIDDYYTAKADGTYDIVVNSTTVNSKHVARTATTPAKLTKADGTMTANIDCYLPDYDAMNMTAEFTTCQMLEFESTTPEDNSITNYDQGDDQEIILQFNDNLADTVDIANAFEVTDENGDPVSGTLNATFGDTRDIVKLQLSGLNLGEGKHTITNKPDTLYNSSNKYANVTYSFDTIDYAVNWSEESGVQYVEGTDKTVTVTLTTPTVLDATNINSAFVVEDISGDTVDGLAAEISADRKTITLQLSGLDLEVGKYYIRSTSALEDKRGRTVATSFMIRSVVEISNAEILFDEDFETGYTLNENWIPADSTDDAYQVPAADGGTWTITYANSGQTFTPTNPNPNVIQVVDGSNMVDANGNPLGFTGNVLQITGGYTSIAKALTLRRDAPGGSIDFNDVASPYYGKQLVYEVDYYIAESGSECSFMTHSAFSSNITMMGARLSVSSGRYASSTSTHDQKNWYGRTLVQADVTKHNLKVVVDTSGDIDCIRVYNDGNLVTVKYDLATDDTYSNFGKIRKDLPLAGYTGQSTFPIAAFEGILTKVFKEAEGTTATHYFDNLKAYVVETLECTGFEVEADNPVDDFNPGKGVTLHFNDKIDAQELKANLVVKDDNGIEINNAVRLITLSSDQKSALVKLDFTKLEKLTHYNVCLGTDFYSKEGSVFTNEFKGEQEVFEFTTCDKYDVSVVPSIITDYDKGVNKTVTITLTNPLKDGVDPNAAFVVTDANEIVVPGLSAEISADRKEITLQLSGIELGDGQHYISSVDEVFSDEGGATVISIIVKTLDFNLEKADPISGTIVNYEEGTEQKIKFSLAAQTTLAAEDIATGFEVVDKNGNTVNGLIATLLADNKTIELDLSGLNVGVGEHTIRSTPQFVDARGRQLALDYKFTVLPFTASYAAEVTGYEPGTDKTVEISLTYPLNDATINNINNSFVVENEAGLKVTGLKATVSEDKKVIKLALKDLDITGGTYNITSKSGIIIDVKGEALAKNIDFTLSTTSAAGSVDGTTSGQAQGSGADLPPSTDFSTVPLLEENFNDYAGIANTDWITYPEVIPNSFKLSIVGERFKDASVSIVEDPANPGSGNMVLKNVAGYYGITGNVLAQAVAAPANYHVVQRNLDDGSKAAITADEYTIVRVKTRLYIPQESTEGIPRANDKASGANYILGAVGNADYAPITASNFTRETGGPSFYTSIKPAETVNPDAVKNQIIKQAFSTDAWHTLEFVFGVNPRNDGTTFPSYEVLVDGKNIDAGLGKYFAAGFSTIGGMVSRIVSTSSGRGPVTVYYDDWSITKETRFATHVNVPETGAPENQIIKLTLTKELDSASMQLIKDHNLVTLTDENGNDVDATVTYSGNKEIVITPTYGLVYQTKYVVKIGTEATVNGFKETVKAADGEAFGGLTYAFETAKALSTHVEFDADDFSCNAEYLDESTSFTYNMQLSEPALTDIIAAVATFNGNDELLGIKYEIIPSGQQAKNFVLTSPTGTKSFRIYIWEKNGDGSMGRLMQLPDEITSR